MRKTIGILAHVDAGKTTLSEQILYHGGTLRKRGRVDHQDAFLDQDPIERARGITVFSDQAMFSYAGQQFTLIDTPGHVDFSSEMERAAQILDYAVLLVSAVEGVQGHTETIWHLLQRLHIPVLIFINKTDRVGADVGKVLRELKRTLSEAVWNITENRLLAGFTDALAQELADFDDGLLERYLEQGYDPQQESQWMDALGDLVRQRKVFPAFSGAALLDQGIEEFLAVVCRITAQKDPCLMEQPFSGIVYKIRRDRQGKRLAFIKIKEGSLRPRDEIAVSEKDGAFQSAKVQELWMNNGNRYEAGASAHAGDVCAVTGLDLVRPGDGIGAKCYHTEYETRPLLSARVLYDAAIPHRHVLQCLRILEEEDPLLSVRWEEALSQMQVRVMGVIQLDVLRQVLSNRFGLAVDFGDCEVLYMETVAEPVMGYGHFEPLRHYAEVHVAISPAARGSGIHFVSRCSVDVLESQYQNLIRTHVLEKEHKGVLLGAPLTDVEIALITGRAHEKHTEGGDFREATYRAIRQGLEKAKSQILEPYYHFTLEAEASMTGRLVSDMQRMAAVSDAPQILQDRVLITGKGPARELMRYPQEFESLTKGKGRLSLTPAGYEPCHNPDEVVARIGYDRRRDRDNTSDSVFCAKGAGFTVKWDEAEHYMHCKS